VARYAGQIWSQMGFSNSGGGPEASNLGDLYRDSYGNDPNAWMSSPPYSGVEALPGELGDIASSFGDLFSDPLGDNGAPMGDGLTPWVTSTIITDPYEMGLLGGGDAIGSAMETVWQWGVHEICGSSPADAYWRSVEFGAIKGAVIGAIAGAVTGTVYGEGVGAPFGAILGGIAGGVEGANLGIFVFGPLSAGACYAAGVYK
jgi:hypothetical protein